MEYRWRCTKCNKECIKSIPIDEYDKEKGNQICPSCGSKLERVIEWSGVASGSGEGWFGKSNGCSAI